MRNEVLTPVEEHNGIFLKREDSFCVFDSCGSKARVAFSIISKDIEEGNECFCTAGSRFSPQCEIVSNICEHLGKECHVFIPKGEDTSVIQNIQGNAHTVIHRTKVGWNNSIIYEAKTYASENRSLYIPFGMECDDYIDIVKHQVSNIPKCVKRIIVPCGSGMTMASIINGLECNGMLDKEVVGVIIGKNPNNVLRKYVSNGCPIKWSLVESGLKYGSHPKNTMIDDVELDPIYEAKCIPFVKKGDLLWVVGRRMKTLQRKVEMTFEHTSSIREAIFLQIKAGNVKGSDAASEIGVLQPHLSAYLYGKKPIPYRKIERLCHILNLHCSMNGERFCGDGMFRDCFLKYLETSNDTCKDVSKGTGIHSTTLYSFKSGQKTLSLRNLEKLATYCKFKMLKK